MSDLEDFALTKKTTKKAKRKAADDEDDEQQPEANARSRKAAKTKAGEDVPSKDESKRTAVAAATAAAPAAAAAAAAGESKEPVLVPIINTNLSNYIEKCKLLAGNWMANKDKFYWQSVTQSMGTNKGKNKMVLQCRVDKKASEFGTTLMTHPVQVFGKWTGLTGDWKNPSEKNAQNQDQLHPIKAKRRLMIARDDGSNGVTADLIDLLRAKLEAGIRQGLLPESRINFLTQKRKEFEEMFAMTNSNADDVKAKEDFVFRSIMKNCVHRMTYVPVEKKEEPGKVAVEIPHPEREMLTFKSKVCKQLFDDNKHKSASVLNAKPDPAYSSSEIVIKLNEHNRTAAPDKKFEFVQHKVINVRKQGMPEPFETAVINSGDVIAMYFSVDLTTWKDPDTEIERIGLRCNYKNDCMLFERGKKMNISSQNEDAIKKIDFGFAPETDEDGDTGMKDARGNNGSSVRVFLGDRADDPADGDAD